MTTASSDDDDDHLPYFGYGSFKPQVLQKILNNAKAFLAFLTLANIVQGITINGLLKVKLGFVVM